jgi:hypothetical protein
VNASLQCLPTHVYCVAASLHAHAAYFRVRQSLLRSDKVAHLRLNDRAEKVIGSLVVDHLVKEGCKCPLLLD